MVAVWSLEGVKSEMRVKFRRILTNVLEIDLDGLIVYWSDVAMTIYATKATG